MLSLEKVELKLYQEAKVCHICGKVMLEKFAKDKNYRKNRDHCHYTGKYRGAAHSICNIKFTVRNKILVVFQGLVNEFERQFECLRENRKVQNIFRSSRKRSHKN